MRRSRWVVLGAATAVATGLYITGLPGLRDIPHWFYQPRDKGYELPVAIALLAILVPLALRGAIAVGRGGRRWLALSMLVLASYGAQLGVTLVGGEGELWERHALGHSEFFGFAAARRGQVLETLRDYERLTWERQLGSFAFTKPPGTFLSYSALVALGDVAAIREALLPLVKRARADARVTGHAEAAAVSVVLMPLGTALTIVPLFILSLTLFRDEPSAYAAGVLYTTSPAVLLITYHLDGALFPLLGTSCCALAAVGARRGSHAVLACAGGLYAVAIYASFSLLPIVGLLVGIVAAVELDAARSNRLDRRLVAYRLGWQLLALTGGFVAALFSLAAGLGFDLATRLESALDIHAWWKRGVPTVLWRFLSVVEFSLYTGLPLVAAWLTRSARAVARVALRRPPLEDLLVAGFAAFFVVLAAATGTNEVARIWLFVVPVLACVAALELRAAAAGDRTPSLERPLFALATAQVVIALVMKGLQSW